jgi:hypothetical protein
MEQRPDTIDEPRSAETRNALPQISDTMRCKIAALMELDRSAAETLQREFLLATKPRKRGRIEHKIDASIHKIRETLRGPQEPSPAWRVV